MSLGIGAVHSQVQFIDLGFVAFDEGLDEINRFVEILCKIIDNPFNMLCH